MFGIDIEVINDLSKEIGGLRSDVQEIRDILKELLEEKKANKPNPHSLNPWDKIGLKENLEEKNRSKNK